MKKFFLLVIVGSLTATQSIEQRAITLKKRKFYPQAVELFTALLASRQYSLNARYHLADCYFQQKKFSYAEHHLRHLLKKYPTHYEALLLLGKALKIHGEYSKARYYLEKAYSLRPNEYGCNFELGEILLAFGQYERAWPMWTFHKYRSKLYDHIDLTQLAGKKVALIAEHGLGDTFFFIRYARLMWEHGAQVTLYVQPPLVPLLKTQPYLHAVYSNKVRPQNYDLKTHLFLMPSNCTPTIETIPSEVPYITAHKNRVSYWNKRLAHDNNFKVGLVWQGNTYGSINWLAFRSIESNKLEPLCTLKGISCYCLQTSEIEAQRPRGSKSLDAYIDMRHGAFMDTAAIMKNLDLVITVDTSLAHLAGALGVPTWVMLPVCAEWRWMIQRTDSPWYPNMRLFRQRQLNEWEPVVEDIKKKLVECAARKKIK